MKEEGMSEFIFNEEESLDEPVEPRSRIWRVLYAAGVLLFILILFMNVTGLSHWILIGRLSLRNLTGDTEAEIVE
jgi:hypothetical protein